MERKRNKNNSSAIPDWRDALAGACAGAVSKTAMAPIERVKLVMQLQGFVKEETTADKGLKNASRPSTTSSIRSPLSSNPSSFRVARHIYETEGILAFWKGNVPNVIRQAGQAALNFALMDYYKNIAMLSIPELIHLPSDSIKMKNQRRRKRKHQMFMVSLISGGLAGGTATTVLYPAEFLRTRMALELSSSKGTKWQPDLHKNSTNHGMMDVLKKIVQTDGIRGLYQGYGIALWGSIVYRFLFLGGYDAMKTEMILLKQSWALSSTSSLSSSSSSYEHDDKLIQTDLSFAERFLLAQTISLTAGTICYPIDSVRRRLMMQAGKPTELRLYHGSIHCFQLIWKQEGLRGFYLGIAPNLLRSIGGALMLVAYDVFKTIL